ncbi:MAG TPA: alkaline phosphatase D family protein [Thermomicrobiales bacterium]|nr:alkaline phosphatase D family protein [Thermomicrobiales bacterium]
MTTNDILKQFSRRFGERAEAIPLDAIARKSLDRRTFLLGTTAAGLGFTRIVGATPVASPVSDIDDPSRLFSLGIASGDPLPDGVVLWTRLAPEPYTRDGGMGEAPVEVAWEVASDEGMTAIVQQGTAMAEAEWAHSIHVEVSGLEPDSWYFCRFRVGDVASETGRTRTAPAPGAMPENFRFAFASCQRWDHGLYTAYRDMAAQDVDLVVHLGDYIYEYRVSGDRLRGGDFGVLPLSESNNLDSYRARYALHKTDPHLKEMHRLAPWIVTWDDHEVHNNFFGGLHWDEPAAALLLERRNAAYKAYYEHQPLRESAKPTKDGVQLYRAVQYGDLLGFTILDTRQYRTIQANPCDEEARAANGGYCPDVMDPERTLLGAGQKEWLLDSFEHVTARWNVLANQVPFSRIDYDGGPGQSFGGSENDKWDGYALEREVVLNAMADASTARGFNPVVITGDVHANYVWDIRRDWDAPEGESLVGTEFVGTSISSNGDQALKKAGHFTTSCGNLRGNTHNHLYDNHRGYVLCDVTPDQWTATYRVMPTVEDPDAEGFTLTSFVVENGRPGAQTDATCTPEG